ncbi:MAG: type II restriction endonuclease, partial [Halobacteria archaeon]
IALETKAFEIFKRYEREAFERLISSWFKENKRRIEMEIEEALRKSRETNIKPIEFLKDLIQEIVEETYPIMQYFEKSMGNMRKARGGRTFELIVRYLLEKLEIPCERPITAQDRKQFKNVDLLVPDLKTARTKPEQSIFISEKRTLRERWKQSVPEMKLGYVYLLTIDGNIPASKAEDMKSEHLIVYVRDELKELEHLKDLDNVRRLSDLPKDLARFK